jgi:hypothetical protein
MAFWPWKKAAPAGPDFSAVDSMEKARTLFERGELEKLLLTPPGLGGQDLPANVVFVPLGLAEVKAGFDKNVVGPLVAERLVDRYAATPRYHGTSCIPVAIEVVAQGRREVRGTIGIWGPGLAKT